MDTNDESLVRTNKQFSLIGLNEYQHKLIERCHWQFLSFHWSIKLTNNFPNFLTNYITIVTMPPKKSSQILTTSQRSTRHASSSDDHDDDSMADDDAAMVKQMVCASVQYILIHSSKAQVIKRLDWTNTVLRPMAADARKSFPHVHKQVEKVLDQTFGYKLAFDEKHDGKSSSRITSFSISYFRLYPS